jgi:hypothetical protein
LKNKGLIISTIVFFLIVNTSYFWEGRLGILAFPAFFILVVVYVGLLIGFFRQLYFAIIEKFTDRKRIVVLSLMTIVLILTFFNPSGLIDFDRIQGADLLVAYREGGGKCSTTVKLKENNNYVERDVCFGVTEKKGIYKLVNDTIYFENDKPDKQENEFYKYALIKQTKLRNDKKLLDLVLFANSKDTIGFRLLIIRNDLFKQKETKPSR